MDFWTDVAWPKCKLWSKEGSEEVFKWATSDEKDRNPNAFGFWPKRKCVGVRANAFGFETHLGHNTTENSHTNAMEQTQST